MVMGGKTYVISLPAPWIKKYGIKKSEELDVEEENDKVVISTGKKRISKSVKLDISGLDSKLIYRLIHAAYIRGADEIRVSFSNKTESELMRKAANTLIGCVIVEEGSDYILIKDVYGPATEFDPIFKRVFFILNDMITESIQSVKTNTLNIEELEEKDHRLGHSINFCLRYLNKKGHSDRLRNLMLYGTLRNIENLGDEYCHLFIALSNNTNSNKKLFEIFTDLEDMFKQYSELFFKFDKEKLINLFSYKKRVKENLSAFSKTCSKSEVIGPLWAITTRTFDLIEPKLEEAY